eukprot:3390353-Prymnesium_polylepis.1
MVAAHSLNGALSSRRQAGTRQSRSSRRWASRSWGIVRRWRRSWPKPLRPLPSQRLDGPK